MNTNKIDLIKAEVEKLKSQLLRGACSSQVAMETRCKEEAYNEVLSILDAMQEEPKSKFDEYIQEGDNIVYNEDLGCRVNLSQIERVAKKDPRFCMYSTANYTNGDRLTLCKDCKELCRYNQKTAAESLGISQETYDEIVDKCLYGSEVELVDDVDLPKEEPVSEGLEKAARKYAGIPEDSPHDLKYCVQDKKAKYDAVLYGANWQKQQMDEYLKDMSNEIDLISD